MFTDMLRHQARPLIVAAAWRRTDNDFKGLALVDIRLRECQFKVQRVQKFNGQNERESENLERLNLWPQWVQKGWSDPQAAFLNPSPALPEVELSLRSEE